MNGIAKILASIAIGMFLGGCAICNERMPARVVLPKDSDVSGVAAAIRGEMRYPRESCLANRQGDVVLRFDLLRSGQFENVRIHESSGDPLLDQEAIRVMEVLRARRQTFAWPPNVPNKDRITISQTIGFRL